MHTKLRQIPISPQATFFNDVFTAYPLWVGRLAQQLKISHNIPL